MKKFISVLFIIMVMLVSVDNISHAEEINMEGLEAEIIEKENRLELSISSNLTSSMEEIESIVEENVYISLDREFILEKSFKLYNFDETELGILTILKSKDGNIKNSGYTIHSINDENIMELTSSIGEDSYKLSNLLYSYYLEDEKIYYEFMDLFYLKQDREIVRINVIDDTIQEFVNPENIFEEDIGHKDYETLRKITNEEGDELSKPFVVEDDEISKYNIDKKENEEISKPTLNSTSTIASLKKWTKGSFLPVYDLNNNGPLYGGDQAWLAYKNVIGNKAISISMANKSCGVTAAANVAAYLDSTGISKYSALYQYAAYDIKRYTSHMREVYDYMSPSVFGIPSAKNYWERLEAFGKSRGVNLRSYYITQGNSLTDKVNFIKNGLNSNTPVSMLTLGAIGGFESDQGDNFNNHWVTITRLYKSGSYYGANVSSWAEMKTVNLNYWHFRISATATLTYTN
ncbi:MAG: hypothetical protein WAO56_10205 [Miniphocaeibacter sp.]|uniref:hypothetical protein n=1 Tax=Miniphocaeibacter sp. TaxID=3100973 RepID=UPI0017DEEA03|nr:hypothetical protein [Gallicola sp.]